MLPKRPLGDTGIEVGVLGLGTTKFGRNSDVKYPESFKLPTDKEILELLALCQDHGINLLDTAPAYGSSEERLGELLGKQRSQWIICTKVGESWQENEQGGGSSYDFGAEAIKRSVTDSCKRLGSDYLDVVLLHSDGSDEAIIEGGALEVLAELKQQGQLRAFGISSKTVAGGCLGAKLADVVMASYRPNYLDELPVLEECRKHGAGVILKKILDSGHQPDVGQSLGFALAHQATSTALIGTTNPAHLREAIDAALAL